jgi:uncharacterized protein YjiS (DUF1127 family)
MLNTRTNLAPLRAAVRGAEDACRRAIWLASAAIGSWSLRRRQRRAAVRLADSLLQDVGLLAQQRPDLADMPPRRNGAGDVAGALRAHINKGR